MSFHATRNLILTSLLLFAVGVPGFGQSESSEDGQIVLRFKEDARFVPEVNAQTQDVHVTISAESLRPNEQMASDTSALPATDAVKQVQFEYIEDLAAPLVPNQYRVAQNPLEDLQSELEATEGSDDMGGLFDDVNEVSSSVKGDGYATQDNNPSDQSDRTSIDDILEGAQKARNSTDLIPGTQRTPSSALDRRGDKTTKPALPQQLADPNTGLRDDSYYQSLGAPKRARKPATNRNALPMTMGNIFGDEDEYDPKCVQEYCRRVWQCAGGRGLSSMARIQRDLVRSRTLQNAQRCGNTLSENDYKCKKAGSNTNQTGACQACQQGAPFDAYYYDGQMDGFQGQYGMPVYDESGTMIDSGMSPGERFSNEVYEDLSEIGEMQSLPTPAVPPMP